MASKWDVGPLETLKEPLMCNQETTQEPPQAHNELDGVVMTVASPEIQQVAPEACAPPQLRVDPTHVGKSP